MSFIALCIGIFNIAVAVIVTGKVGNDTGCFGKVAVFVGTIILLKIIEFIAFSIVSLILFV